MTQTANPLTAYKLPDVPHTSTSRSSVDWTEDHTMNEMTLSPGQGSIKTSMYQPNQWGILGKLYLKVILTFY